MNVFATSLFTSRIDQLTTPPELARQLRRADDFIRLAVEAAYQVLQRGEETVELNDCGIILGSSYGTMQTNFEVLELVVSGEQTSPTLFSHSVYNSAAGYLSSIFSLKGPALTITDFNFPFFRALNEARIAIGCKRMKRCLVLQVETYSDLLRDVRRTVDPGSVPPYAWQPGVACWLLEPEAPGQTAHDGSSILLKNLNIVDSPYEVSTLLAYEEEVEIAQDKQKVFDPVGSPILIGEKLQELAEGNDLSCLVQSPWGYVELSLAKG